MYNPALHRPKELYLENVGRRGQRPGEAGPERGNKNWDRKPMKEREKESSNSPVRCLLTPGRKGENLRGGEETRRGDHHRPRT